MIPFVLAFLLVLNLSSAAVYQTPPPTFDASPNTKWVETCNESKRANIHVTFDTDDAM